MKLSASRGFTLIELLIVIALLGALAVGLLATIDPFEQLKKGKDTSLRNTVSEFYNANLRYYSTKGVFPWTGPLSMVGVDTLSAEVDKLITMGELKNRFMDLAGTDNLAKIFVTSTGAEHLVVCYQPESKAFQQDANTIYGQDGGEPSGTCKSDPNAGADAINCWYCIQ